MAWVFWLGVTAGWYTGWFTALTCICVIGALVLYGRARIHIRRWWRRRKVQVVRLPEPMIPSKAWSKW
jgi:hypothetical protein